MADCPRNETRKSKFEAREPVVGFRTWILQFRFSSFDFLLQQSTIGNQQSSISGYSRTSAWWRTSTPSTRNRTSSAMLVA
jgi:hypothetical protein